MKEKRDSSSSVGFCGMRRAPLPIPGNPHGPRPSVDAGLLLPATATERVEIGTCIYCFGLVNAGNFAQSAYTLEAFAPKRVTLGLGTGSQKQEWDVAGLDWESRFKRMDASLAFVKSIFTGNSDIEIEEFRFGNEGKSYEQQRAPTSESRRWR